MLLRAAPKRRIKMHRADAEIAALRRVRLSVGVRSYRSSYGDSPRKNARDWSPAHGSEA